MTTEFAKDTELEEASELGPLQGIAAESVSPEIVGGAFIDWPTFWERDRTQPVWVYEDVLARGRGHLIGAAHK